MLALAGAMLALAGAMLALIFSSVEAQEGDEQEGSVPAKPTGLSAQAYHDRVELTWDDPGDDGITGYQVFRRDRDTQDAGEFSMIESGTGSSDTSYTDTGVEPETRYVYRVKAINEQGASRWSGYARADTPAAPEPTPEATPEPTPEPTPVPTPEPTPEPTDEPAQERPAQPTGLTAPGVAHDHVALSWDDPEDNTITGYEILRRDKDIHEEGTFETVEADTGTAETTYTDDTVEPEHRYVYRIKAINAHGVSEISSWVRAYTPAAPTTEPNSPATGAPTITGTAQVGETLTADTSGIADADGLDNAGFSHQWLADDADMSGATASTYTLADADEGKTIKVRVSFTDDADNDETLTSAATAEVAARPNSPATGAPTISGTAQVRETLAADTSGISDEDGLENASFSYQWLAGDADISGATNTTYTLADADEGKAVSVRVSFTDDRDNEESLTSAATAAVSPAPGGEEDTEDGAKEYAPLWSATMTVEWVYQGYGYYSTDTKQAGSLTPDSFEADGAAYTVTMIEANGWLMYIGLDREVPFDFALELDGAQFASGDASFNAYSYGNVYSWTGTGLSWSDGDTVEVRLLHAVEKEEAVNVPATGAPAVTGTAQVGETLTADASGIADEDGLDDASFSYQWIADGVDIAGATGSTYTPAEADAGKTISVRVSFTDDGGNEETLTSAATDAVAGMPPAQPTGLSADLSVKQVTLTWDDPQDDTITGYVILRRIRGYDADGVFTTHVEDTGSAATAYTDDATEWETPYTYRIQAVNEHGTSERSRWVHVETPRPPALEGRKPLRSAGQRQVQQRQDVVTLVSNVGELSTADGTTDERPHAQLFTTGSNEGGYTLSSIDVVSEDDEGDEFTVSVCTVTGGNPSSDCTDLTSPSSFAKGTLNFTAPANTVLAKDTTYAVVITPVVPTGEMSAPLVGFSRATSDAEDAGAAAGWSIADSYQVDDSGWGIDGSAYELVIAVKGSAVAGTETPDTDETPANQVWSGTVTVAAIEAGSKVIAYGFLGSDGSLDDTGFTVDGTDYTIDGIFVGKQGESSTEGSLNFSLASAATTAHEDALVLHAGDEEYVIGERNSETAASSTYEWEDTDLDWESQTSVTLRLTLQSVSEVSLQNDLAATTATIGRGPGQRVGQGHHRTHQRRRRLVRGQPGGRHGLRHRPGGLAHQQGHPDRSFNCGDLRRLRNRYLQHGKRRRRAGQKRPADLHADSDRHLLRGGGIRRCNGHLQGVGERGLGRRDAERAERPGRHHGTGIELRGGHHQLRSIGGEQRDDGDGIGDRERLRRRGRHHAGGLGHQHDGPPGVPGRGRDHHHGDGDGGGRLDRGVHRDGDPGTGAAGDGGDGYGGTFRGGRHRPGRGHLHRWPGQGGRVRGQGRHIPRRRLRLVQGRAGGVQDLPDRPVGSVDRPGPDPGCPGHKRAP